MSARPKLAPEAQLTIEEFLAFAATRPDEERWELIEGEPVLNAAPSHVHQLVDINISTALMNHKMATGAPWLPSLGVGTRVPVSPRSLPQPDVYVQEGGPSWSAVTDDALVVFEVLSPSNDKSDQAWRRKVYASVPNLQHYVTISLKFSEVVSFDRPSGWAARTVNGLDGVLELPALGMNLSLRDVYRFTPLMG